MDKTTIIVPNMTGQKQFLTKAVYFIVLISFILSVVYLNYRTYTYGASGEIYRATPDYNLMIVQCLLGIIAIHIPSLLNNRFKFEIPPAMQLMFFVFLFCAIFLGEVLDFYNQISGWDNILHFSSSVMTGLLGCMVIKIISRNQHEKMYISPLLVAIFAFCFSICIGALWEIYEFSFDGILGLNMQKFRLPDGTELTGRLALTDTMKDIVVDTCGALTASLFGYFSIKHEKGWIHNYLNIEDSSNQEENESSGVMGALPTKNNHL